jgi:HD-GYP domain-containing protein (c-di-GMP phosphodiesterase class II)
MSVGTLVTPRDLVGSGSPGVLVNSSRAGYFPVPLERVPPAAFEGLPVFLRTTDHQAASDAREVFALYRGVTTPFTEKDRERLLRHGNQFVYVHMTDHARFHAQLEVRIDEIVADSKMGVSARAAIVYETGVELVNELLADPNVSAFSPRLTRVARAVVTLAIDDPSAFSHLFATSHHDFYTATHMVNVATYMVALAYALGYRDPNELQQICHAGLLHDIGKVYVPEQVLNKTGPLSDEDWWLLKRHPELGHAHLQQYEGIPPLVLTVTHQHHERLNGSGYPAGLPADQIHPVSRICAVADCFDAMTAFRPFKQRTLSVDEALTILKHDAPQQYEARVVAALSGLIEAAARTLPPRETPPRAPAPVPETHERRGATRLRFTCPARLHLLTPAADGWQEQPAQQVVAHNISSSGLGILSQSPISIDERVHVYLDARGWNIDYLEAQTVRCRSYRDGWYEVGMQLIAAAPLEETDGLERLP